MYNKSLNLNSMPVNMEKFTNRDVIYFCNNNSKIRSVMAYANEISEVYKVIADLMILTEEQKKAVNEYWNRNNK